MGRLHGVVRPIAVNKKKRVVYMLVLFPLMVCVYVIAGVCVSTDVCIMKHHLATVKKRKKVELA